VDAARFHAEIVQPAQPALLRGLVGDWPAVGADDLHAYLQRFASAKPTEAFFGKPEIGGKYYYNSDLSGFNFERRTMSFPQALSAIYEPGEETVYLGSLPVDDYLPGFASENPMAPAGVSAGPRLWIGHPSDVSSHYDTYDNLICCVAGVRKFTLYSPDCIGKLYVGPIDNTMAGQPVSLAASLPEDAARFPLFADIKDGAIEIELRPGDALYLPKLWWHQVRSTAPVNAMINYWWDATATGPDSPYTGLLLSMIAIAERPPAERRAWKAFFDHYVFREAGHPLAHLPAEKHGILGPLKPDNYGRIRARIMHLLRSFGG
jgi:hypothetical protein